MASAVRTTLQHRVWRWHFFAGLMVIPFAVILAVTGSIYLFKPQFDAAVEARINSRAVPLVGETLPAGALLEAGLAAYPGASLSKLYIPSAEDDPTIELDLKGEAGLRMLWIDRTTGAVLHSVATPDRFMNLVKRIHGTLLAGDRGSLVVEIMASWMIILIVTGVYLWWPRGAVWWRVFVPSFGEGAGRRETWRKVHGMGGAWIGGVVLAILFFGLPWTQVWGDGFTKAKALAGLKTPGQEWFVTLESSVPQADHSMHEGMDHGTGAELWDQGKGAAEVGVLSAPATGADVRPLPLEDVLRIAAPERYAPPVEVQPPRGENGVWTIRSMAASRPDRVTVHHDRWTGAEVMRIEFADHNPVDRFMALGIAFHEGALFGWLNQVVGVIAALGLILLSLTGGLMWWRRRPKGRLGTPPMPSDRRLAAGVAVLIVALGIFLPMAGVTLLAALAIDLLVSAGKRFSSPA
ncbi:MAG: PepSY domain-containing protein [Hyphomonas sp.]